MAKLAYDMSPGDQRAYLQFCETEWGVKAK